MDSLPLNARRFGYAGLLPQIAALAAVVYGGEARWSALALSFGYAALIFSFLGGVWWGLALAAPRVPRWVFGAAVLPSLLALALWYPWMVGETWPGPELVALGILIAASPLVDRAIGFAPAGWMALRWQLSLGLGGLTLAIGVIW
jgi:hypothetical protein